MSIFFNVLYVAFIPFSKRVCYALTGSFVMQTNMKPYAESFYKSNAWKQCRQSYFKSVGGLCERCLSKGLYVPAAIVHHKVHITEQNINNPSITLNHDNLEALCRDCHKEEHPEFGAKRTKKRWFVDESGHVIPFDDEF